MEGERNEDGEGRTRVSMYEYLPCFPLFDITMTMAWKMSWVFFGGGVCLSGILVQGHTSFARACLSFSLTLFAFRHLQLRDNDILLRIRKEGVWGCFTTGIWIILNPSVGPF